MVDPTADSERRAGQQAGLVTGGATPVESAAACARLAAEASDFVAERGAGVDFMGGDLDAARRTGAGEAALEAASSALRAGGDVSQIKEAIRADLAPWVLGYSDPVRERCRAWQVASAGECPGPRKSARQELHDVGDV